MSGFPWKTHRTLAEVAETKRLLELAEELPELTSREASLGGTCRARLRVLLVMARAARGKSEK